MNIVFRNTILLSFLLILCGCSEASKPSPHKKTNPKEKAIKELTFDEAIQMAKEIDQHPDKECYWDKKPFDLPTECFINDRLVHSIEYTLALINDPDTTAYYGYIPRREFFFINEEYTVIIHSVFNNPTALENKWDWFKMVFKQEQLMYYKYYKHDSYGDHFIDSTSTMFKNADKNTPVFIERHLEFYSDLPKVLLNLEVE